jgi:hypothetical protein
MSELIPAAPTAGSEFAAFVAIDWADQKHYWKLYSPNSAQTEHGELPNTPEAIEVWAVELGRRFPGRPIAVILEQKRGPLVYQLSKYVHLVLFPAHPTTLARYRQAFCPSGSKNDPGDTGLLLEILLHHRDHLRRLDPDTPETRLLQILSEQRRKWVDEKTALSNGLTAWLKSYFPQALDWFDDIDSPLALDFLERWPALEQLQCTKPNALWQFFTDHNSRSEQRIQARINAIYQAVRATHDRALEVAGPQVTAGFVRQLKALQTSIDALNEQIRRAEAEHPDAPLFAAVPGAGPALRPRLIVAFGTQRERYATAAELQAASGIAPVQKQSGNTRSTHFRQACPKFLRQTFHEFAAQSIKKSQWARACYDYQREDLHKSHHAAVRVVAFKWIRVLFACWKTRTPYDEATYLRALERHHSPLTRCLDPHTQLVWKEVAGFQKPGMENA